MIAPLLLLVLAWGAASSPALAAKAGPCGVVEEGPRRAACTGVLEARELLERGQAAKALPKLGGAAEALPEARAHLETLRGRALLDAGQAEAALALARALLAEKAPRTPGLEEKQLQLLADAQLASGERKAAVTTLTSLLEKKPKDPARVRAQLVRTLLDDGQRVGARPHLERLLVDAPEHRDVKPFERFLDEGSVKLSDARLNRRLQRLLGSARYERAILEARRRGRAEGERGAAAVEREVLLVTALARAGRNDEAVAHAAGLVREKGAPDAWRKVHAWALGKAGALSESGDAWLALSRETSDVGMRREACFFAGFLAYEANDYRLARERLEACAKVLEGSGWASSARWYRALTWLLEDEPGKALPILEELVRTAPNDREADKHRYWLARAKLASGDEEGGKRGLRLLATSSPTSWYGLLARARLGLDPVKGAKVPGDALSRHAASDESARRARLLHALGFDEAARSMAAARGRSLADLALSQQLGDAHRPWRNGARFRPTQAVKAERVVARDGWRASYPEPYAEHVKAACERHGLDPALAWAIMRTESGFLPTAESVVGALGLMQLMPYTAQGIAKVIRAPAPKPSELLKPAVSVELGVAVLALGQRELGHPLLSVASYNGSPTAVSEWMRDFGHLEPELFVERIPFRETRDYVKKVLPDVALYRALAGEDLVLELPTAPVGKPPARITAFPPVPAK